MNYDRVYGTILPIKILEVIEKYQTDKEEMKKLAFYDNIRGKEVITPIDEI